MKRARTPRVAERLTGNVADELPGPTYVQLIDALDQAREDCQQAHGPACWPCPHIPFPLQHQEASAAA